ncbi:hypothetical protein BH09MYX1_BH09MYX1_29700 [soil metagenome]
MRRLLLLVLLLACSSGAKDAPPAVSPAPSARTTGPEHPDRAHPGSTNAPQSFTPAATPRAHASALQPLWTVEVGPTTSETTMLVESKNLYIGTATGISVVSAKGALLRKLALPLTLGLARDGTKLFAATTDGAVVVLSLDGTIHARARLGAAPTSAPALADFNADGVVDAVVGDVRGNVTAVDGKSGSVLWQRAIGSASAGAASLVDLDGDGTDDIVVGSGGGALLGLRGKDGATLFTVAGDSPMRAPPIIVDVDGDGRQEIVATWSHARVAIISRSGQTMWSARVEEDDGTPDLLGAAAVPIASLHNAVIAVATSGLGARDGVVLVGERQRAFRSHEGRVTSTPIVTRVETEELPAAIVGTDSGAVIAFDALGNRTSLTNVGAPISASLLVSDVNSEGLLELFVVTANGALTAFLSPAPAPALVPRYRGASPHNDGRIPAIRIPWRFVEAK